MLNLINLFTNIPNIISKITGPPIHPLIAINEHPKPSSSDAEFFQNRYEMRYDLCAGLKNGDWESMSFQERSAMKDYFGAHHYAPCAPLRSKFMEDVTSKVEEIAKKMGFNKNIEILPHNFPENFPTFMISHNNELVMSYDDAADLIGGGGQQKQLEYSGIIAHEISHRILNHQEKMATFKWILKGDDHLLNQMSKCVNFNPPLNTLTCEASEANEATAQDILSLSQQLEKEADLLTLKVPEFARGNRDAFQRIINDYRDACQPQIRNPSFADICDGIYTNTNSTHPRIIDRVAYTTEALCHLYPQVNKDICT